MADYKILLGVDLKVNDIRDRIKQYNANSNNAKVKLGVKLDTKGISNQIKAINSKTPVKVDLKLNTKNAQKQINDIRNQIQQLGNIRIDLGGTRTGTGNGSRGGAQKAVNDMNWAYRQMLDISKKANALSLKINSLDTSKNVNEIKELSLQFARLKSDYETLKRAFGSQLSASQFGNLQAELDETTAKLSAMDAKIKDTKTQLANGIKLKLDDGTFANDISNIESKFGKLSNKSNALKSDIDDVKQALTNMSNAAKTGNTDKLVSNYEAYEQALKNVNNQLRINAQAERDAAAAQKLADDRKTFQTEIDAWLTKNSAATKKFGAAMLDLKAKAQNCDKTTLNHLRSEFKQLDRAAEAAGLKMQTFGDKLRTQFSRYKDYLSVATIVMYAFRGLKDMFEQVKLIDSAMTELKKVTNETDATYNEFLSNAATRSRELGTTIDGLVSSTADFARLGYGFKDAQGLAEVANIYAVVGDEIEGVEGATESLISTLAAFKDEASEISDTDFAMDIVDKFNEVSNNFAISSGGIGEAMQRSASSLKAANNTIDESIALITAANTVTQDPAVVGNAFKTMSMRIRGAKTELEEAGLETEGMVESTAKLRAEILALSGVDIMLDNDTFKSTYQILDELAVKWKDLTDIQQASVTELIAGKRQGNVVSSLMNNFQTARDALETSLNSSGSAMREHEKWQQSLEAQINKVKASWQGLSQAFMKSDFLHAVLDGVISLVDGLTKLIDTFGTLPTLLGAFAGFKGISAITKNLPTLVRAFQLFGRLNAKGLLNVANVTRVLGVIFPKAAKGAKTFGTAIKAMFTAMTGHPIILAITAALTVLTAAFAYHSKQAEKLAEKVDELTAKFQEEHKALKELKGNYDTTNESSMISKYEKLSKGVDGLGRNVSLTAEEYSEYQSIVNSIAEQIPSLVTGYDEEGNALLSCKGNVEALTEAYQKLIHAQNQEILTNTGNIEKDFANTIKEAEKGKWYKSLGGIGDGTTTSSMELLEKILNGGYSESEIKTLLKNADDATVDGIYESLKDADIGDLGAVWSEGEIAKTLSQGLKTDSVKIKGIIDDYYTQFVDDIEQQKTIAQAKLSEAFDVSSAISGLNYGDISEELRDIAYQTVNSFDYDFLTNLSESGKSVEQWTTEMLNQLNAISKADNAEIEAGFELQTKFNGGEISYGEYIDNLQNIESVINKLNLKNEAKEQLKISLGLDDEGVIDQYNALVKRLTDPKNYDFDISKNEAKKLLDGLSSEELAVAVDVITEMSNNNVSETIDQVREAIDRELTIQGLTLDLNIEAETAKLESLATALSESVSGSGLSKESLNAVEGIFGDLSSYDPSKLFERTANGIRLNSDELRRLNSEYKKTNISDLNKEMDTLGDVYNQTKEELYGLTYGTDEYNAKAAELNGIEERIKATEQLAAQYKGLASAYQEWQMAESAGSQRDMYEGIIEGFENIDDEISRGWYDDGTIEFLELLSGKDLSTAGIEEVKKAYKSLGKEIKHTSYSVRDFFTVDEDGNSTNTGVYNFLDAVGQLEEEAFGGKDVVQRKDGKIIGFDFQIAGGDKAIAEALGISEELVQIMVRAADDAGFVVSMDGTYQQLDILKEKAAEAAQALKETFKVTEYSFFQDGSEEGIAKDYQEALKVWETFKKNKNKDGTVNMSVEGAEEAFTLVSTLQSMVDQLSEPVYMELDTSDVEKEMQTPLKNLQQYETLLQTEHQLKLKGTDTSGIEEDKEEILTYFEELSPEIKADLGIKDDSREEIAKKLEDGTIEIPATVDLQVEMNETLRDMVNVALYNAGLIDDKELETRVDISVYAEDVDTSDIKNKTEKAVKESVENKDDETVAVETTVELETTIEEATELIEKFEDKDITIDVKVKGLNDVKQLNKQINLATDIDGNVDKLSDYVESAKELSKIDGNISSYVSANIKGNVTETPEYKLNNLRVFANSVKDLEDIGSFTSNVKADVKGNVIETAEFKLNNLKVFSDNAKGLDKIGSPKSEVTAEVKGNVTDTAEFKLNNLKVFTDNAKDIHKIGDVESKVTANVEGNVVDTFEYKINNLKAFSENAKDLNSIGNVDIKVVAEIDGNVVETPEFKINNLKAFSDSAKGLRDIGSFKSEVTAEVKGNVTEENEYKINNLKVFSDSAKDLKDIGNINSEVTANIDGNVIDEFEYKINNLKALTDSAKDLEDVGNVTSSIVANVDGDVVDTAEFKLNNLKVFTDSAKDLKSVGSPTSNVTANVDGNVIDTNEFKLNNLEVFADGAEKLKNVGSFESKVVADLNGNVIETSEQKIDNLGIFADGAKKLKGVNSFKSEVTANISGNVIDEFEYKINNLGVFADSAKNLKDIGDVSSNVTASVDGNIVDTFEYKINNLKVFSDSAKDLKNLGNITSKVTADVAGNVIDTVEESIDNLKVFYDSAKDVSKIGTVNSKVTADVEGNVIDTPEYKINNLKVFSDSAKDLKRVGSPTSKVTADVTGNVINTLEEKIDNLGVFADNANKLKNTGNFTSSVAANVSGNVITDDSVNSDLEHFASIVSGMSNQTVTVSVSANVDSAKVNEAITLLTNVASSGVFKDYKATVQVGATIATIDDTTVKNYKAPQKEGKVKYSVDQESSVFTWTAPDKTGTVNYSATVEALTDAQKHKTGTITYKANVVGLGGVAGTAHANGSASGRAFARGDWGIKGNGVALGGELGRELVVRDGKFFTIGDNGAEFFRYKKNDIVFNAAQTESLFKYGGIKGANPRGKMLASGTAFAEGLAFNGSSTATINGDTKVVVGKNSVTGEIYSKSKDNSDFKETFDWVETAISRIEREIDNLDQKANRTYKSWSSRNNALTKEISKVGDEIGLQQKAYDKYMAAANGVGLSSSWAKKVRNGEIDINTIKDEALAEKIKSYQDYYNKALDCKDAIEDLKDTEAELYKQRFDNISAQYDGLLGVVEHEKNMLDEQISQAEVQGHLVSENYYKALMSNERKNQAMLMQKRADLLAELGSGNIEKGTEAWYDMVEEIDATTLAIEQSNTALLEYEQTLQQLDWEVFDLLQERISNITEEADFLIELMSNDNLYNDNGKLTDKGMATAGLHGQNYNVYMHQADYYGEEAAKLDAEIASDPYDTELIARRDEMLSLQRESILAAEDEKQAIIDLVEEGINVELDALQERIDKYNESLDAAKDLYDYNKRVKEQTKEIASLEKQMAAYQGDDSEESRAKIQELKVSLENAKDDLEETEYDKYISDQKALLDELYLQYDLTLNERLDNTDAIISEMIAEINADASLIGDTISQEASNVGYELSTEMSSIWSGAQDAIAEYGKNFSDVQTTTNNTLSRIELSVQAMVSHLNAEAARKAAEAKTSSAANPPSTNTNANLQPTTKPETKPSTSGGDGKAKVGDKVKFVSGQYYYDSYGTKPLGSQERGNYVYITYVNEKGSHPYHISRDKANKHPLGWLKLNQISGYATGKKNIGNDEYAWTQENGREFIVRPSDGAILTPVAKSDSVLNATASGNIWNMANSPAEFIKDNLNLGGANVPNNSNIHNSYTQHLDKVVFSFPNVKNYDELLSAMQKDPNFERLVESMSIGKLAGKSSLAKGKAIR